MKDGTASCEKETAAITKLLCQSIVSSFPAPEHYTPVLDTLMQSGLGDPQDDAAACSCVVMHGMIRGLGATLNEIQAKKYFETLVESIDKAAARQQVVNGILMSIRNLTKHHNLLCYDLLLKFDLPHPDRAIKSIQSIGSDSQLCKQFLLFCLDIVLNTQLVEDKVDAKDRRKVTKVMAAKPLSAVCAVGWVAACEKGAHVATTLRSSILCNSVLILDCLP